MDKIKNPINKAAEQAANEKYSYFQGVLFLKLTDWNLEQQGWVNLKGKYKCMNVPEIEYCLMLIISISGNQKNVFL